MYICIYPYTHMNETGPKTIYYQSYCQIWGIKNLSAWILQKDLVGPHRDYYV